MKLDLERDVLLALDDAALQQHCRIETFRGTGPGGQKRNRTNSAVRATLQGTDISASSDETRSQHTNRRIALQQLRCALALAVRKAPQPGVTPMAHLSPGNPAYPLWLATLADALDAGGFRVSDAARHLGCSTGRLVRIIAADGHLWAYTNRGRQLAGLPPLRR